MRDFFAEVPATAMTPDQVKALFNEVAGQYLAAAKTSGADIVAFYYPKGNKVKFFPRDAEGKLKNATRDNREEITNDLLAEIDDDDWMTASCVPAGVSAVAACKSLDKQCKEVVDARPGDYSTAEHKLNKRDISSITNSCKGKTGKAKVAAC